VLASAVPAQLTCLAGCVRQKLSGRPSERLEASMCGRPLDHSALSQQRHFRQPHRLR